MVESSTASPSTIRDICFVILPFSETTPDHTEEYWTAHYEEFLKPIIEENPKLEARRSQPLRGDLVKQIITDLVTSIIVVADLTDHNCNVFWELGIRQSFKYGTVTIAQSGTRIPFDLGRKSILFYESDKHVKMEMFRRNLKRALADCLLNPTNPDSDVLEAISGRGTLFELYNREHAQRRLDAVLIECERNEWVWDAALRGARKNQSAGIGKRTYPTSRLSIAAVELLVTNRYIDAPDEFYSAGFGYYTAMVAANDQLIVWEHFSGSTEKWIISKHEDIKKPLKKFTAMAKDVHREFTKRL